MIKHIYHNLVCGSDRGRDTDDQSAYNKIMGDKIDKRIHELFLRCFSEWFL
jgi:hypothetical protein